MSFQNVSASVCCVLPHCVLLSLGPSVFGVFGPRGSAHWGCEFRGPALSLQRASQGAFSYLGIAHTGFYFRAQGHEVLSSLLTARVSIGQCRSLGIARR